MLAEVLPKLRVDMRELHVHSLTLAHTLTLFFEKSQRITAVKSNPKLVPVTRENGVLVRK